MSNKLASRFYQHDPVVYHGTPCWENGREGFLEDAVCVLADVEIAKRSWQDEAYYNGTPCWEDGREGIVRDAICVVADVSIEKRSESRLLDGARCWRNGHAGIIRDTVCVVVSHPTVLKPGLLT